jgi:hypothetical protein
MTIKISQLPNVAVYSDGILIPIVDSSTGTPTTTKATGGDLKNFILGNIQQDVANINGNIIAANVGMTGYVTAVSSAANVGMRGYVDLQFLTANTAINNSNTALKGYVDSLTFGGLGAVTTANIGMTGYVDQANTIQSAQIAAANVGIIGYIDRANTIQSAQITSANLGIIGYVDAVTTAWTANAYQQRSLIGNLQSSAYSNANIISYLASSSIVNQVNIPAANISFAGISNLVATSLFALTSSVGNLTVVSSGNIIMNGGYLFGNLMFANGLVLNSNIVRIENNVIAANTATAWANTRMKLYVDGQITSANAGVTAANVGMIGYVGQQITTANTGIIGFIGASITSSNLALKGYVDNQITTITGGAPAILDTLGELANALGADANLSVTLTNKISNAEANVITANTGMRGYVDFANTVQSNQLSAANIGMKGYVDSQDSAITTAWTANAATQSDLIIGINANVTAANVGMKGYVDNSTLTANTGMIGYVGNQVTTANVGMKGYVDVVTTAWTANAYQQQAQIGNLQSSVAGLTNYSNVQVATYLPTYSGIVTAGNVAVNGNITAQYIFGNGAFLTGVVTSGSGGTNYSNANVATYLPTYSGVLTASNVAVNGNVTAVKFFGDGSSLSGVIAAATAANITVQDEGANLTTTLSTINFVGAGVTATFANSIVTATISGYSNVNAATYLVTYGGAIQSSNVQATIANIQSNTATTSMTTGALKVVGGVGIRGGLMVGGLRFVQPSYITVSNTTIYALSTTTSDNILVVSAPGFTANLTIPPAPSDGQVFTLSVVSNSVTINKNGAATMAPDFSGTTAAVGTRYRYIYRNSDGTWYAAG